MQKEGRWKAARVHERVARESLLCGVRVTILRSNQHAVELPFNIWWYVA